MTEIGGPTTQAGIDYQNRIAALYLGDLLSFDGATASRVIAVRVEAPALVDDIVVTYADGRRLWIQAKLTISKGGTVWAKLWQSFYYQCTDAAFGPLDRLSLTLGESAELANLLHECTRRTTSSGDDEWRRRMTAPQLALVEGIDALLGASSFSIFQRLDIDHYTTDAVGRIAEARLPTSNMQPATLLGVLQQLAGLGGGRRKQFHAPSLRDQLSGQFGVHLESPSGWGAAAYLRVMAQSRVDVPGTSVGGSASSAFHWPHASRSQDRPLDFDDEQTFLRAEPTVADVDLRLFPGPQLSQCIVHAGPGFGKSSLLNALAAKAAGQGLHIPAILPLSALAASDREVLDYLSGPLNAAHRVRIDWTRLCETDAALLLLDGLDEVPRSERVGVINKLTRFTQRYPGVPWMLTVRDLAVLPAAFEAEKLELSPLTTEAMQAFAQVVQPSLGAEDARRMIEQVTAYPELERLVRIPLFLALLVATWTPGTPVPTRRSELIETYLKTLFRPEEHKETQGALVRDPALLRDAMQGLAYRLIEFGEIGSGEHEVRKCLAGYATHEVSTDALFDDALRCGILKRTTPLRVAFPFPIVQEYLAGQDLVEKHASILLDRAQQAIERPWAQTVQFALERLPDGTGVATALMDKPGDAFATNSRLLARCILNGMPCSAEVRQRIGDALAESWPRQSYWTARRVGQIIDDGWSTPPGPAVREALLRYDLKHDGASQIVARLADDTLTLEMVSSYLKHEHRLVHLGDAQSAADRVAGPVLELYLAAIRAGSYESEDWAAGSLVGRLDPAGIPPGQLAAAIDDADLPRDVRLALIGLRGGKPGALYWQLAAEAFGKPDDSSYWASIHALRRMDTPALYLEQMLRDDRLSNRAREVIADHLNEPVPEISEQIVLIERLTNDATLLFDLRVRLRIRAANLGHRPAFEALLDELGTLGMTHASRALRAVSHFADRSTGERVVNALRQLPSTPGAKVTLASALLLGAMYKCEVPYYDFGAIIPVPLHPSFADFLALTEEWWRNETFELIDRLRMTRLATERGLVGAKEELYALALRVISDIDTRIGDCAPAENPFNDELRYALDELGRVRCYLPLSDVIGLAEQTDSNAEIGALVHIGAIGTREALDYLVKWSRTGREYLVLGSIETIATRLGITIVRDAGGLTIATDSTHSLVASQTD